MWVVRRGVIWTLADSQVAARLLTLRKSPILLQLPPYLSLICIVVGIGWILLLPLNEYSRQTYVSENAILPGQVHTYFGGSEHNIFRAYRQEVFQLAQRPQDGRLDGLQNILNEIGLKTAQQRYSYNTVGDQIAGINVYGLLQGPRADATEAMVLIAAWRNFEDQINYSGIALALTLARYFKRWSIWSKDIILLIPEDSTYGSEAWVSAYHSTSTQVTSARNVSALPIKSGALQGAVALDYPVGPWGHRFDKLDIQYDGINGASPNLDLLNTAVSIASGQMGIGCSLHGLRDHSDSYKDRLTTLMRGLMSQAAGHATGPHSAFMPYHIDAITLKTVGDGWHDEMSLGRTTESLFRSINNLLEHLHQSFFFYILLSPHRFVSIGNYLPAAMILAGSFTVNALALWVLSGRGFVTQSTTTPADTKQAAEGKAGVESVRQGGDLALVPSSQLRVEERGMLLPAIAVLAVHLASVTPLSLLTHLHHDHLHSAFSSILVATYTLPILLSITLSRFFYITPQQIQILQSFSLLCLGATLSTWATINFSLAMAVGILASPLAFVRPVSIRSPMFELAGRSVAGVLHLAASPPAAFYALSWYLRKDMSWLLLESARGWAAMGVWTYLVVWGVWWSAWVLGGVVMWSGIVNGTKR